MIVERQSKVNSSRTVSGNPATKQQLLNWFEFNPEASVLQIDADDCAITELLINKCSSVSVLEKKAENNSGLRKLKSQKLVSVFSSFKDIENHKFDYIIAVSGNTIIDEKFITSAKQLLKPNATLILGVDNKFGLQKWNGAVSSNKDVAFSSIQDGALGSDCELSRREIEAVLSSSSLGKITFFYPMPGLSQPGDIFSDEYLPSDTRLLSPHAAGFGYHDNQLFSNTLVMRSIIKSGAFPEYANTFLVFAGLNK